MFRLIVIFLIFMCGYLFKGLEKDVAKYAKTSFNYMINQIQEGFDSAEENPTEQPKLILEEKEKIIDIDQQKVEESNDSIGDIKES